MKNRFLRYLSIILCMLIITGILPAFGENKNADSSIGDADEQIEIITEIPEEDPPQPAPAKTEPEDGGEKEPGQSGEPASGGENKPEQGGEPASGGENKPEQGNEPESGGENVQGNEPAQGNGSEGQPEVTPEVKPSVKFDSSKLYIDITDAAEGADISAKLGMSVENCDSSDIVWSVSDTSVASVEGGILRAIKPGSITVRAAVASDSSVYAEATVVIKVVLVMLGEPETIEAGMTFTLELKMLNNKTVPASDIIWSSSDESCATVVDGVVTIHKLGNADISATYYGTTKVCSLRHSAEEPGPENEPDIKPETGGDNGPAAAPEEDKNIALSAVFDPIYTNSTGYIIVRTGDPAEGFDAGNIRFIPDAGYQDYFTIDGSGYVTPVTNNGILANGAASVTINVTVEYLENTCVVPVTIKQAATGIYCDHGTIEIPLNSSVDILDAVRLSPEVNGDRIVSVSVSDNNCFVISEDYVMSAMLYGKCSVTVTAESGISKVIQVVCPSPISDIVITAPGGKHKVGESAKIDLKRYPAESEAVVAWSSSNREIASVDEEGTVYFKNPGEVTITAKVLSADISKSVTLRIVRPAEGFTLYKGVFPEKTDFVLAAGKTVTPVIQVYPANASDTGYYLVSSDSTVLQVYNNGKSLKGIKAGYATVTVCSSDGEASMTLNFTVTGKRYAITSFKLSASKINLVEGSSKKIKVRFNSSAYDKNVEWVSTDPEVATVVDGVITGINPGKCTVYALNAAGGYKSVKVTVSMKVPSRIKLNVTKGSMYVGEEYQFVATITPSGITREEALGLTWKTSNKNVVIVNEEGRIFAISPGKATITVTTVNGKKATCRVTVKPYKVTSLEITHEYTEFIVGGTYDLDVIVGPENATNKDVKWSTSSSSRVSVNKDTGVIKCKKPGTVTITARAKDGSGRKHSIKIKVVKMPLNSASVMINGAEIENDAVLELKYRESMTVNVSTDPVMFVEYTTSDDRIASVDRNGVITATGCGSAKITVTIGGQHKRTFNINVPYDENAPRYRALVISQYTNSKESGYLPFSTNSANGIIDALSLSDLEGSRYTVTHKKNFTDSGDVISCINSTFADAREGDVSVIYIITHGNISTGDFKWHLKGSGNKSVWLYPSDVMNALAGIRGNVVLVVLSCYSGGDVEQAGTLQNMISELDGGLGIGESYSVITSTDGSNRSSYVNTDPSFAYDFFTYGLCAGLGWDMTTSTEAAAQADTNNDGIITLKELAKATEYITREECERFVEEYGTSGYWGPTGDNKTQNVQYYISEKAEELPIHCVIY